jgi:hypothetical protein
MKFVIGLVIVDQAAMGETDKSDFISVIQMRKNGILDFIDKKNGIVGIDYLVVGAAGIFKAYTLHQKSGTTAIGNKFGNKKILI